MSCPYLLEIDENKRVIHCDKGVHMKYLDYFDTKREICCNSFTKCKTYLCRQLVKMGVQLPWSEYNAEKLLEIYQQKLEEVKMNEIIETNTEQVALELLEQQIINQCRIQVQAWIETGRLLKMINDGKGYAARGFKSFKEYMEGTYKTVFPFRYSQACKYIRVFERFGHQSEKYCTIDVEVLNELINFSDEELNQLAEENKLETMTAKEAKELRKELEKATEQISFLQSTAKEKEEEYEGKLASAEGRIKELMKENDELDNDYAASVDFNNAQETKISELEAELAELKNRPVEVAVSEPDPEEVQRRVDAELEKSKAAYKAEISKLEKNISDLKEQAESADNIKKGYEKKLQALNDKLDSERSEADERVKALEEQLKNANGKADEEFVEFKFYFSNVQENLKKFIAVLDKIEEAEKKEKFKGAALQFLEMIMEELKE